MDRRAILVAFFMSVAILASLERRVAETMIKFASLSILGAFIARSIGDSIKASSSETPPALAQVTPTDDDDDTLEGEVARLDFLRAQDADFTQHLISSLSISSRSNRDDATRVLRSLNTYFMLYYALLDSNKSATDGEAVVVRQRVSDLSMLRVRILNAVASLQSMSRVFTITCDDKRNMRAGIDAIAARTRKCLRVLAKKFPEAQIEVPLLSYGAAPAPVGRQFGRQDLYVDS